MTFEYTDQLKNEYDNGIMISCDFCCDMLQRIIFTIESNQHDKHFNICHKCVKELQEKTDNLTKGD